MAVQRLPCVCMERIAEEIRAWKEAAVKGLEAPQTESAHLLACERACWVAASSSAADLVSESQIEGLARWALSDPEKALSCVRQLLHPFGSSQFSQGEIEATSSASSSLEQAASATTGGAQHLQDSVSASSCPDVTPKMIEAGALELALNCDPCSSVSSVTADVLAAVYIAMSQATQDKP